MKSQAGYNSGKMNLTYALAILLTIGCASAGTHSDDATPPATTMHATVTQIKAAVVSRLLSKGYSLDNESTSQLVFSKEQNGGLGVMAQALEGSAHCAMPRHMIRLTMATIGDSVLVMGTQAMQVQQGLSCTPHDIQIDGQKNRNEMESFLADIKVKAEAVVKK